MTLIPVTDIGLLADFLHSFNFWLEFLDGHCNGNITYLLVVVLGDGLFGKFGVLVADDCLSLYYLTFDFPRAS